MPRDPSACPDAKDSDTGHRPPPPYIPSPNSSYGHGAPSTPLQTAGPRDLFSNAHHFSFGTLQVINNSSKPPELESDNPPGWKELLDISAPNALHNSRHRFDPPKCDEDTRVDVIGKLMSWIQDRGSPTRLLCMTGAAGAGKSALQQTIAERCAARGILAASFFFSSTDHSRNHTEALIPTIAYQLGIVNPVLMKLIAAAMNNDQLIRTKSMDAQMEALIIQPLSQLRSGFDGDTLLLSLPYAILIDGLDECVGEKRQAELLEVIRKGFLDRPWIPFRIFIASRPEWAIRTALEPHGNLNAMSDHLRLSDMFDATADIRRTLRRRLREIGDRSSDPRARSPSWPSQGDVESLVSAASGQYIYADAILRYVADRYCSPVERLQIVLTWRPSADQFTRPFAALDLLYTNILVTAKNAYESVDTNAKRNFLVLFNAYRVHMERDLQYVQKAFRRPPIFETHDHLLGLEKGGCAVLISDLHSLVAVEIDLKGEWGYERFRYYHKSFQDFLDSEARSGSLFVGIEAVNNYIIGVQLGYLSSVPLSGESLTYLTV
ncbi:hypothetical protein NMY22_g12146 [Coprinellus aureogranulatus]|nr:hypothetical protein NMY22_g12146 [Coprinellus aureogranulatus]